MTMNIEDESETVHAILTTARIFATVGLGSLYNSF
jgi:hypothetical protein